MRKYLLHKRRSYQLPLTLLEVKLRLLRPRQQQPPPLAPRLPQRFSPEQQLWWSPLLLVRLPLRVVSEENVHCGSQKRPVFVSSVGGMKKAKLNYVPHVRVV